MSQSFMNAARDFTASFTNLARLPRAFWIVLGAFVVESSAYFGVLTLMASYVSRDLGWGDVRAGFAVSLFTMAVTLFMLGAGSYAEGFGLRRAILFALLICTGGRALYSLAPGWSGAVAGGAVLVSLLVVAVGAGILQPVCYSGVKQYTDQRTSSMGYALIYAIMNLGIVGIGALSAWVRPAVQDLKAGAGGDAFGSPVIEALSGISMTGVQAVNWACAGITGLTFVLFLMLMTRKVEAAKIRPDPAEAMRMAETRPLGQRLRHYFAEGPFSNTRFLFFIFMLLPVRTLFAHQWLTFPEYILRAYDKDVADHMEWLVNSGVSR